MTPDADLVQRARAGSEQAFRDLVERYQRPIYNLIARLVRDPGLAEDLAQETFVKVFTRFGTYDPAFKFSSWIFRIAHNTAIDHLRQRLPVTGSLDGEGERTAPLDMADLRGPGPLAVHESRELARMLDWAIDRLRAEYRQLVVLRYQEDLGYEEIAEITSLPLGTVKSYLHRARAELAELVKAAGWGPATSR